VRTGMPVAFLALLQPDFLLSGFTRFSKGMGLYPVGCTVLFPCSETSNVFLLRFALGPAVLESEFRADHESGLRIEQSPRGHYESSVWSEYQLQILISAAGCLAG
jgi:hypothetical protein